MNQNLVDLLVEYEALQTDMENQEKEIDQAGKDLEKAEAKEKQQYEDMKLRIKYMYENGEESYLSVLVSATILPILSIRRNTFRRSTNTTGICWMNM